VVDEQVAVLDARIAQARRAREMLLSSRDCPAPEPVRECPYLRGALDALVAGEPMPPPHDVPTTTPAAGNAGADGDG
jgi:MerR family transcriptional regulator, redox-sensitive transcriptional activator SoxR